MVLPAGVHIGAILSRQSLFRRPHWICRAVMLSVCICGGGCAGSHTAGKRCIRGQADILSAAARAEAHGFFSLPSVSRMAVEPWPMAEGSSCLAIMAFPLDFRHLPGPDVMVEPGSSPVVLGHCPCRSPSPELGLPGLRPLRCFARPHVAAVHSSEEGWGDSEAACAGGW